MTLSSLATLELIVDQRSNHSSRLTDYFLAPAKKMADKDRFFGDVLGSAKPKSAFADTQERARMALLRDKIQVVRRAWLDPTAYHNLIEIVRKHCKVESRPKEVREPLQRLLEGARDYADIDARRAEKAAPEQYDALELYCSSQGYRYLFGLMTETLRAEDASEELLLTATVMIEFLTIDLYNLRLTQIGDTRYANFQGITYRGLTVSPDAVSEYESILANPDLSKRCFAIPLGLMSTSTEERVMHQFAQRDCRDSMIRMHWAIHIHGIDPDLLKAYRVQYPESVVTSICAMPVAKVSPHGEKEVLLRGAFFQLIDMKKKVIDGHEVVKLVLVMMNSNRDHTTEQASNEGEKEKQREAFRRIVVASRYEVCASLAGQNSLGEAEGYRRLQQQLLDELHDKHNIDVVRNSDLADARSTGSAVWLGASLFRSYPRHYAALRLQWQEALSYGDWVAAEEVLMKEYDWHRSDWYNVGKLNSTQVTASRQNFTLLHELATKAPPDEDQAELYHAWRRLVEGASLPDVWKSLKSFDQWAKTAETTARECGFEELANLLVPKWVNNVDDSVISELERQLHQLMRDEAGTFIDEHGFHMPQLSIFKEMEKPILWVPIPYMYGGFLVKLVDQSLEVTTFETVVGHAQPRETTRWLFARQSLDRNAEETCKNA